MSVFPIGVGGESVMWRMRTSILPGYALPKIDTALTAALRGLNFRRGEKSANLDDADVQDVLCCWSPSSRPSQRDKMDARERAFVVVGSHLAEKCFQATLNRGEGLPADEDHAQHGGRREQQRDRKFGTGDDGYRDRG